MFDYFSSIYKYLKSMGEYNKYIKFIAYLLHYLINLINRFAVTYVRLIKCIIKILVFYLSIGIA